jgi:ubiquitin carboxyl-terminal hydrolase L5
LYCHPFYPYKPCLIGVSNCRPGLVGDQSWTEALRPTLQSYFDRYADSHIFNVLAICQSPTRGLSSQLATALHTIYTIEDLLEGSAALERLQNSIQSPIERSDAEQLAKYGLTRAAVFKAPLTEEHEERIYEGDRLLDLWHELSSEARKAMKDLDDQIDGAEVDQQTSDARRMDYTPAIHAWMKTLAEKGVLEDIIG